MALLLSGIGLWWRQTCHSTVYNLKQRFWKYQVDCCFFMKKVELLVICTCGQEQFARCRSQSGIMTFATFRSAWANDCRKCPRLFNWVWIKMQGVTPGLSYKWVEWRERRTTCTTTSLSWPGEPAAGEDARAQTFPWAQDNSETPIVQLIFLTALFVVDVVTNQSLTPWFCVLVGIAQTACSCHSGFFLFVSVRGRSIAVATGCFWIQQDLDGREQRQHTTSLDWWEEGCCSCIQSVLYAARRSGTYCMWFNRDVYWKTELCDDRAMRAEDEPFLYRLFGWFVGRMPLLLLPFVNWRDVYVKIIRHPWAPGSAVQAWSVPYVASVNDITLQLIVWLEAIHAPSQMWSHTTFSVNAFRKLHYFLVEQAVMCTSSPHLAGATAC